MTEPVPQPVLHRIRVAYSRGAELRYVSHLDMQLVWERTLRRARLPVAYSQGFSPRPRFHMASSLPLGFTSRCEIADLWLIEPLTPTAMAEALQKSAPPGMAINHVEEVDLRLPALQTQVQSAEFLVNLIDLPENLDVAARVTVFLAAASIPRIWRKKPYDLRALVNRLEILPGENQAHPGLFMDLAAREGATGRPDEVLSALGLDPSTARVERVTLKLNPSPELPRTLIPPLVE